MAIRLLRLKSGEDIVSDINEKEDTVVLENPAVLVPMGDPTGRNMQMGFGPWIPYVDGHKVEVEISRDHVVFIVTPGKDITNNYRQAFGSGIVVPEVKVDTKKVLTE